MIDLKALQSKELPNLFFVVDYKNNLLFGYQDCRITFEKVQNHYHLMTEQGKTLLAEFLKNNPGKRILSFNVQTNFVRARQMVFISMPFIVENGQLISDPNGVNILMRKINAVYN